MRPESGATGGVADASPRVARPSEEVARSECRAPCVGLREGLREALGTLPERPRGRSRGAGEALS